METAQVIFYPLRYCVKFPTYSQQIYFEELQYELRNNYWHLKNNIDDKYDRAVQKQSYHNYLRNQIEICEIEN